MGECLWITESMPYVCVLRDDSQGHLLATAPDQDRQVSNGLWIELGEAVLDDRHRGVESHQPSTCGPELIAVFVVVLLEPAASDSEDQPAAGDHIDGPGHVRKQLGVPIAVAGDERTDLDVLCRFCPCAEHGPALEVLTDIRVRIAAIEWVEVVPVVEHVDAELLGLCCGTRDVGVAGVLWVKLDGDAHVWHLGLLGSGHLTITATSSHDDGGYPRAMDSITYRPITDEEYPAFARALVEGFSDDMPDEELTNLIKSTLPAERTLAAFDGDEIVGTFGGYDLDLTIPGGHVAMEGTTVVTVFPTHRRMGLMSEMMRKHLENSVANGYPIAGLWASASSIYDRYGFGVASYADTVTMRTRDIVFRDGIDIDRVRRISVEDAHEVLPPVFDSVLRMTPGMYARSAVWWKADVLHDADWTKQGKTSKRIVIHEASDGPDGYAIYRQQSGESDDGHPNGTVHIIEIIAATDRAHASLWSYLTNVDGCPNIRSWNTRVDDPLAMKLVEPRRIKLESHFDALWILILDVVVALEARSYEHDGTIRFTVAGSFRPDVRGSYELSVENGVGSCTRIEEEAELVLDIDVLGALYLGGCDTSAYASAGRVRGDTASTGRLHELFRTARSPWCNQVF